MSGTTLERAAAGQLPAWASVSAERCAHIARVADLLSEWAQQLAPDQVPLWRAAALLHDALRDADPRQLMDQVDPEFRVWPSALLHGPAAARRIALEHPDAPRSLLDAVAYHTVGHPRLELLGRALYLADFLEIGRSFSPLWRTTLRVRMPYRLDDVLKEVTAARISHLVRHGQPLRPETIDFWNAQVSRP
jgi:2-amino-4-hydroxy-6-hydroxymethyldihydropteridine diphosphokinase